VKKEKREKNGQSLDGFACRAGIALHAGLKTSARNIATAKALICNLLPLPSAFCSTFPRTRRWYGLPKRNKDNTMKTRGSPWWSTRDDMLLKYTCDRSKQLKSRKIVSFDFCEETIYIFSVPLRNAECFYVSNVNIKTRRYMQYIFAKSVLSITIYILFSIYMYILD